MVVVLRYSVGSRKRRREVGRGVTTLLLLGIGVVLCGDTSVICPLFFCYLVVFSSEIGDSFEVRSHLLIKESDFVKPILENYDSVDAFFIRGSETSDFVR